VSNRENLFVIGISHHRADVARRERAALSPATQEQFLSAAANGGLSGVAQLAILATCNRTELYAVGDPTVGEDTLRSLILTHTRLTAVEWQESGYTYRGDAAVRHGMGVAGGLDSQLLGEGEILRQIVLTYERARQAGSVGAVLATFLQRAIHAGKRIRHETTLSIGGRSLSGLAIRQGEALLGRPAADLTALVIGAGAMARSALAALKGRGVRRVIIANRTPANAESLAAAFGARLIPLTELSAAFAEANLVITASSGETPMLVPHHMTSAIPRLIVDLGVPRNVDPAVGDLRGQHLYNLDDLHRLAEAQDVERRRAIPHAEAILSQEVEAFLRWHIERAAIPAIRSVQSHAAVLRQAATLHLLGQWGWQFPALWGRDWRAMEWLSRRLTNKLIHRLIYDLKAGVRAG